jgi:hypothetical protein
MDVISDAFEMALALATAASSGGRLEATANQRTRLDTNRV